MSTRFLKRREEEKRERECTDKARAKAFEGGGVTLLLDIFQLKDELI